MQFFVAFAVLLGVWSPYNHLVVVPTLHQPRVHRQQVFRARELLDLVPSFEIKLVDDDHFLALVQQLLEVAPVRGVHEVSLDEGLGIAVLAVASQTRGLLLFLLWRHPLRF